MSFLEIKKIRKNYGSLEVLRGISMTVEEHEVICLIGPSGCGKSTLLRCVNGLESIEEGEILLEGECITGPGVDLNGLRRKVGIVFQSYNLFPHLSVIQNITLAPVHVLKVPKAEARERGMELLRQFNLETKAQEYPDRLSGGQQQRVAIVRALAMEPKLLLLDEITSALDPELVFEVLGIVRALAEKGMTMIIAAHQMGFAKDVATKVCFLYEGVVHEEGAPEQIFGHPEKERTKTFIRSISQS